MSTAELSTPLTPDWSPPTAGTLAQLVHRLGDVPLQRILVKPPPGTAAEKDLLQCVEVEKVGCELADGTLVVKTMGYHESLIAMLLSFRLMEYLKVNPLGMVAGESGICRLLPGLVRTPDVSFVSIERLKGLTDEQLRFCPGAPDLCVEILSAGNTRREMERKLGEYFEHGARLVWYIDPVRRTARTFTSPNNMQEIAADGTLSGSDVLPGLTVSLREFFAEYDLHLARLPIQFQPPTLPDA
jgi:Uma2 family endonuclease